MRSKHGHILVASLTIIAAAHGFNGAAHAQSQDSNYYYERGVANREQSNAAQARADFSEAIRLDPQNANAYIARGGDPRGWADVDPADGEAFARAVYRAAKADYDEAIRLAPQNPEGYRSRARLFYAPLPDKLADFDEAIRLDPQDADTFGRRAAVHFGLGNRAQAFSDLDEAIRLDPRNATNWFDRGLWHRRAGNSAQSEADFARALRIDPSLRHYYLNMR